MIRIDVPGDRTRELECLALDLNGTIALDGRILDGVAERLGALAPDMAVYLLTADTQGKAAAAAAALDIRLHRIVPGDEARQKQALVRQLGAAQTVAIGNGANDALMLAEAALGIAVLGPEGLALAALRTADVVVPCIEDALDLLLRPRRLVATLRR